MTPILRLTPWGVALALCLAPTLAPGQSGQLQTGPKVTAPETNENIDLVPQGTLPETPPAVTDVLPPVPATASDPAPPGTRAVRVDGPVRVEGPSAPHPGSAEPLTGGAIRTPAVPATPEPAGTPALAAAEGVVTAISAPQDLEASDAVLMIRVDTSVSWADRYGGQAAAPPLQAAPAAPAVQPASPEVQAARAAAEQAADAARQAQQAAEQAVEAVQPPAPAAPSPDENANNNENAENAENTPLPAAAQNPPAAEAQAAPAPAPAPGGDLSGTEGARLTPEGPGLTFVITRRTNITTTARTAEGVDLPGAQTFSSPDPEGRRAGGLDARPTREPAAPQPTNFTNIREGSFVVVRYLPEGPNNIAQQINLIELPVLSPPVTPVPAPVDEASRARLRAVEAGTAPAAVGTIPAAPSAVSPGLPATTPITEPAVEAPGTVVEPVPAGNVRVPSVPADPASPGAISP